MARFNCPKSSWKPTNRTQTTWNGAVATPISARNEDDDDDDFPRVAAQDAYVNGQLCLDDVATLVPHFQQQKDALAPVDRDDLRRDLRDVVSQMDEVAEFMVEELAKDKTIARVDQAAKEFHWIAADSAHNNNPTFFELQTAPRHQRQLRRRPRRVCRAQDRRSRRVARRRVLPGLVLCDAPRQ